MGSHMCTSHSVRPLVAAIALLALTAGAVAELENAQAGAFGRFQLREGYYTVVASQLAKWCPSSAHLLAGACGGPARAVGTPVLARPGDATLWQLSRRAGGWSLTIANGGRSCKPGGALQAPRACGSAPGVSAGVQSWTLQPAPLVAPNAFYLEAAASPKGCAQLRLGVEAGNCWTAATPRMYAAATTGGQTTWLLQPAYPPRCGGVLGALQAQGPKHAELAAVVAAVSHLVPELASSRFDVEAPVNWLVHRWLRARGGAIDFARQPSSLWSNAVKATLARDIRRLLVAKARYDSSCPTIRTLTSAPALERCLGHGAAAISSGGHQSGRRLLQTSANGAWGPIYVAGTDGNNNTAAVGTGYNILLAGPNAFSASLTGTDPGLLFAPIFSSNLGSGMTPGDGDSDSCTTTGAASYSAGATQRATSTQIGVQGAYGPVTASANAQFGGQMQQLTTSAGVGTLYQCYTAYQTLSLPEYANMGPSALDATFYTNAVQLLNAMVTGNYSLQDEAILLQLNQFVQSYGTHYVAASQAGGVVTQACQMSTFGYTYAEQNGFSFSINAGTAANNLNAGTGMSHATSANFSSVGATCSYVQAPANVAVPLTSALAPDMTSWLNAVMAANALKPVGYTLSPLSEVLLYTSLFPGFTQAQLNGASQAFDQWVLACSPGNANGWQCMAFSNNCASQSFLLNGECASCYTAGPACSGLSNGGQSFAGCNATTCFCNSPWQGTTCETANVGTCTASGTRCAVDAASTCCAPGFNAVGTKPSGSVECGCTCAPIDAKVNGWALAGCGTEAGFYCGCGNSKVCTKSQTCVYPK